MSVKTSSAMGIIAMPETNPKTIEDYVDGKIADGTAIELDEAPFDADELAGMKPIAVEHFGPEVARLTYAFEGNLYVRETNAQPIGGKRVPDLWYDAGARPIHPLPPGAEG
jgi:hypothetical protein